MSFDRLWAPWRLDYVSGNEPVAPPLPTPRAWHPGAEHSCFLCRAAAEYDVTDQVDRPLLVAHRGALSVVVLNRYPYNNGHVLVAPRRHVAELCQISPSEHVECMECLGRLTDVYRDRMKAEGFNIGVNLGRVAGAGLPGHLHWHLVPRWSGDHNFMGVVADTRVIPQALDALWEMLVEALRT